MYKRVLLFHNTVKATSHVHGILLCIDLNEFYNLNESFYIFEGERYRNYRPTEFANDAKSAPMILSRWRKSDERTGSQSGSGYNLLSEA